MFEQVQESRSSFASKLLPVALALALVGGGIAIKVSSARRAAAKAAVAEKSERDTLTQMAARLAKLQSDHGKVQEKLDAVEAENSAPKRKGGPHVPRDKWSEDVALTYRLAEDELYSLSRLYNGLATQYNERLATYKGPWPDGTPPGPVELYMR